MLSPLLLTLLPILLILILLLVFRTPADLSGILGWKKRGQAGMALV